MVSWQARGFTKHDVVFMLNVWSRQAWLQAMQVLISSRRPVAALFINSLSANIGRAMETRSASPRSSTSSATSGMLIRLEVMTGILTSLRTRAVTLVKAARGTMVAMVGTFASCHTKCVEMMLAPAFSSSFANSAISSQLMPPCNMSIAAIRKITMKSSPTAARTRRTTSSGKRIRFS